MSIDVRDQQFMERIKLESRPEAHPDAVVRAGDARFTFLTDRLVRLEWAQDGAFDDRASYAFPTRYADAPPQFQVTEKGGRVTIDTGRLRLSYRPASGRFAARNLSIELTVGGEKVTWRPGQEDRGNLFGARRTLDGCRAEASISPGILSREGWVVFDDSGSVRLNGRTGWIEAPAEEPNPRKPRQDWYFFGYGHDYKAALGEYTFFGGQIPLIPRYVLGLWWSRYWEYSAQDLKDLVNLFHHYDIPLDVLVIDMDWHTKDSWTGYTWDRKCFPDPEGFLQWAKTEGLHTTLNLHPHAGVQPFEETYEDFAKAMGVEPNGKALEFDISDPKYMRNYFELLHHPREKEGVDFWWMDWQQGESSKVPGLDPLIWLNHLHFRDLLRTGQRPMLFSRWGSLGNHRYPIGFSGDTFATWEVLNFMPHFTATASNVAYGWWSHDIGAHFDCGTAEQYVRWVQFGAVSPCLRLHSAKHFLAERRPWAFGEEALEQARRAVHLRYELLPYLYTAARQTSDTAVGPCRPMYYESPEQNAAYAARWQYYLGDQLIAAPIVSEGHDDTGMAGTTVWFPEGTWIDYTTLETYTGPRWTRVVGGWERLPLFAKAGAIIPWADVVERTRDVAGDVLRLKIFPGPSGAYRHYEDDAASQAYVTGDYEWTSIKMNTVDNRCVVEIAPVDGRCASLPAARRTELTFVGVERPTAVLIDGQPSTDWTYDEQTLSAVVAVPERSKTAAISVRIDAAAALGVARNTQLVQKDAARLLGRDGDVATLLDAAYAQQGPAADDAIARLGGPFFFASDLAVPEVAKYTLGMAVLGAPADGSPFTATGVWRIHRSGRVEEYPFSIEGVTESQVLDAPFAFDGTVNHQYWTLDVSVRWNGRTRSHAFRSRPLIPTVPKWHTVVISRRDTSLDHANAVAADGTLNPALKWQTVSQDIAKHPTLTDEYWFPWPKKAIARLLADKEPTLYAAVVFECPEERVGTLRLVDGIGGHIPVQDSRLYVNGEQHPFGPKDMTTEVTFKKGLNRIVVHTHLVGCDVLGLYVLHPDGTVMTDLTYQ